MDRRRIDHDWQMPSQITPEKLDVDHMMDPFGSNGIYTTNPSESQFIEPNPPSSGFVEPGDYYSSATMNQNMGLASYTGYPSANLATNSFNYTRIAPSDFVDSVDVSGSQATDTSLFSTAMSFETENHPPYSIPETDLNLDPMSIELSQIMSNGSHLRQSSAAGLSLASPKSKTKQRNPIKSPGQSSSPIHRRKSKRVSVGSPSRALAALEASIGSYSASSTFKRKYVELLEPLKQLIEKEKLFRDLGAELGELCSSSNGSSSGDILSNSGCDFQTDNTSLSSAPGQPVSPAQNSGSSQSENSCRHHGDQTKSHRCTYEACLKSFKHFSDWKRHEENHYPQERFMCLTCLAPEGASSCRVCKTRLSMQEILEDHLRICLPLHDNPKPTFARKYHLNNHLRNQHGLDEVEANDMSGGWNYALSKNWPRVCEFCEVTFTTWDERMKHLAKHFQKRDHFPSGSNPRPGDDSDNDDDFDDQSGPPRKRVKGYTTTKSGTNSSGSAKQNNNSSNNYYTSMGSSQYAKQSPNSRPPRTCAELSSRTNHRQLKSQFASEEAQTHYGSITCQPSMAIEWYSGERIALLGTMTRNKWSMLQNWIVGEGSVRLLCLQDFNDVRKSKLAVTYLLENSGVITDGIFWFNSEVDPRVEENLWDIARQSISCRPEGDPDAVDLGHTWWETHGGKIPPETAPITERFEETLELGEAIYKWLRVSSDFQAARELRQENTRLWLLGNDEFLKWKSTEGWMLWIYAGCGKTLLNSITESCHKRPHDLTSFFSSFTDVEKEVPVPENVLRSIITQLLAQLHFLDKDEIRGLSNFMMKKTQNSSELIDLIAGTNTGALIAKKLAKEAWKLYHAAFANQPKTRPEREGWVKIILMELGTPRKKSKLKNQKTAERSNEASSLACSPEQSGPAPTSPSDAAVDFDQIVDRLLASRETFANEKFIGKAKHNTAYDVATTYHEPCQFEKEPATNQPTLLSTPQDMPQILGYNTKRSFVEEPMEWTDWGMVGGDSKETVAATTPSMSGSYTIDYSLGIQQAASGNMPLWGFASQNERPIPSTIPWDLDVMKVPDFYDSIVEKEKEAYVQLHQDYQSLPASSLLPQIVRDNDSSKKRHPCRKRRNSRPRFTRLADHDRHYILVHPGAGTMQIPCDYAKCSRQNHPFTRKDHFRDHYKDFQKEDVEEGKKSSKALWEEKQAEWESKRRSEQDWWQCHYGNEPFTRKDHCRDHSVELYEKSQGISEGNRLPIDKKTHWRSTKHEVKVLCRTSPKWWRCPKCLDQELQHQIDQQNISPKSTSNSAMLGSDSLFDLWNVFTVIPEVVQSSQELHDGSEEYCLPISQTSPSKDSQDLGMEGLNRSLEITDCSGPKELLPLPPNMENLKLRSKASLQWSFGDTNKGLFTPPPPPPLSMRPKAPPHPPGRPTSVNSIQVSNIRPKPITAEEATYKEKLTGYLVFTVRKVQPTNPKEKSTWARATVIPEKFEQGEIAKQIKRLSEKNRKSVAEQKAALTPFQCGQVSRVVDELVANDQDPNFVYTLAQIDSNQQAIRQPRQGGKNSKSTTKLETVQMTIYIQRSPLPHVNYRQLYHDIEETRSKSSLQRHDCYRISIRTPEAMASEAIGDSGFQRTSAKEGCTCGGSAANSEGLEDLENVDLELKNESTETMDTNSPISGIGGPNDSWNRSANSRFVALGGNSSSCTHGDSARTLLTEDSPVEWDQSSWICLQIQKPSSDATSDEHKARLGYTKNPGQQGRYHRQRQIPIRICDGYSCPLDQTSKSKSTTPQSRLHEGNTLSESPDVPSQEIIWVCDCCIQDEQLDDTYTLHHHSLLPGSHITSFKSPSSE